MMDIHAKAVKKRRRTTKKVYSRSIFGATLKVSKREVRSLTLVFLSIVGTAVCEGKKSEYFKLKRSPLRLQFFSIYYEALRCQMKISSSVFVRCCLSTEGTEPAISSIFLYSLWSIFLLHK